MANSTSPSNARPSVHSSHTFFHTHWPARVPRVLSSSLLPFPYTLSAFLLALSGNPLRNARSLTLWPFAPGFVLPLCPVLIRELLRPFHSGLSLSVSVPNPFSDPLPPPPGLSMAEKIKAQIKDIEDEVGRTQKNKATNAHLGLLKARMAKLRQQLVDLATGRRGAGTGGSYSDGFGVRRTGHARLGLVGFPSVGKSTLLSQLTSTKSVVAAYAFTTLTCIPGVFKYKGAKFQLLDLPGIIEGAAANKGRGRAVISVAYTCDLLLIVLDALEPITHKRLIEYELEGFGIRLNKQPPDIDFRRQADGGLTWSTTVTPLSYLDDATIRAICHEYRINSASILFRCDATPDDLIDVILGTRVYIPAIYVLNKIDGLTIPQLSALARLPHCCPISSHFGWNLDGLLEMIWQELLMIRVYTKPKGEIPDYSEPVILRHGAQTVADLCDRIHRSLRDELKYAKAWGSSVKHSPQIVGLGHELNDEDVIQLIKRR